MNYFTIKDKNHRFSQLTIGSAQINKTYGIDTIGKPSDRETQSMLLLLKVML